MTQEDMINKVRSIVNPYKNKFNVVFKSEWLSNLFLERYWWCKENNIKPDAFKWVYESVKGVSYMAEVFYCYFENIGWISMSFNKAVKGLTKEKSLSNNIDQQFRIIAKNYRPYLSLVSKKSCKNCGKLITKGIDHAHHENISFTEIYNKCIKLITKEDIDNYNFMDDFLLKDNHPAVLLCHEMHKKALIVWLCEECHKIENKKQSDIGIKKNSLF